LAPGRTGIGPSSFIMPFERIWTIPVRHPLNMTCDETKPVAERAAPAEARIKRRGEEPGS